MSTTAYRAMLVRKIEQERARVGTNKADSEEYCAGLCEGLDHALWLIKDAVDL